eukprot:scaffold23268_cov22-Prasinocladus_malaysianus.AAC.1
MSDSGLQVRHPSESEKALQWLYGQLRAYKASKTGRPGLVEDLMEMAAQHLKQLEVNTLDLSVV